MPSQRMAEYIATYGEDAQERVEENVSLSFVMSVFLAAINKQE